MSDFISTTGGKIVNLDAIAFLTSRTGPTRGGQPETTQLVIGFSAAAAMGEGGLIPLSLVLQGKEAAQFLDQLETRGVDVKALRRKLS